MSKSTNIGKYAPGMMDLIEAVCLTGKPCPVAYPDEQIAKRERFEFYGLIRAIKVSKHTLAPMAARLTFSLTGPSKNVLVIALGSPVNSDFYARVAENHIEKSGDTSGQ